MSFATPESEQPTESVYREPDVRDRVDSGEFATANVKSGSLLLESLRVVGRSKPGDERHDPLKKFLAEDSWAKKLAMWFGAEDLRKWSLPKTKIVQQLERDIAKIDRIVAAQLNLILHHEKFQKLEASWRGLDYLVSCKENSAKAPILIQIWNVTWAELRNDQEGAVEFDQSLFFKKVYEEGLGQPGASPFSAVLADFDIHPRPSREHPYDDIAILQRLSETAAAAFCPLFINASPAMFGVDKFSELRQTFDLEKLHSKLDFLRWQQFRDSEESRFVSVVMPRMLLRKPYRPEHLHHFGFPFAELPESTEDHLWAGAVYAIGEVLIRSFAESRWFADIRGVERGVASRGLVQGPTNDEFSTESEGVAPKPLTEALITDVFERQLAKLGFMSLCNCKDTPFAAFYSCPSAQKPRRYNSPEATSNAELSAMTNYMLCAARFGHYVKVITRDKIGGIMDAVEIQDFLCNWLIGYVNRDPEASPRIRAERPLLDGSVQVRSKPGRPGEYDCVIQLEPYHSFDDIRASLKLDTKLVNRNKTT